MGNSELECEGLAEGRDCTPHCKLDELCTLLRSGADEKGSSKQRAVAIIAGLAPDDLYDFMQQLASAAHVPQLSLQCNGAYSVPELADEVPDSPQRLAPANDQQLSPCLKGDSAVDGSFMPDIQQSPDSPLQRPADEPGLTNDQQQEPSGRCFLAESLDLNLGASYDWLAKASLADFSSVAASARLSTTGLVRQSHMRVLSPVAEASYMSAPADTNQPELSSDRSESTLLQQHAALSQQHYQQQQHVLPQCGQWQVPCVSSTAPDIAPSACSSPRESACSPTSCAAAAAGLRRSVAESAYDWPNSQPLPFTACDADVEESTPVQHQPPSGLQSTPAPGAARAAAAGGGRPLEPGLAARHHSSSGSAVHHAGAPGSSGSSTVATKRRAGPFHSVLRAPMQVANAVRRSITGLKGGRAASSTKAPPSSSTTTPQRSLACASAPIAAVYGAAPGSGGTGPGLRQQAAAGAGLAVQRTLPSFTANKQQGSSPSKAAATAATAAAASSKKAAAAAASARHGISSSSATPQRTAASTGYRPPGSAASRAAAAATTTLSSTRQAGNSSGVPAAGTAASRGAAAAAAASRAHTNTPTAVSGTSGYGRPSSSTLCSRPGSVQQQQQRGPQGHAYDRPSSQASVMSYRSDRSIAATGSHTSGGGALPSFDATKQMLQGSGTQRSPAGKQQQSRLQKHGTHGTAAAAQQHRAVAAAGATVAAADAAASRIPRQLAGTSGIPQMHQGHGQRHAAAGANQPASKLQGGMPCTLPGFSSNRAAAPPQAHITRQLQQQQQHHALLQGLGSAQPTSAFTARAQQPLPGTAEGCLTGGGAGRSRSRIGGGTQLRRSRSCGSISELVNVSDVRQMWQQREAALKAQQQQQQQHHAPPAAVAAAREKHSLRQNSSTAGGAAGPYAGASPSVQQNQSSSSSSAVHGSRVATAAAAGSSQHRVQAPAAAVLAEEVSEVLEGDPELPMLSRCQSPTRPPGPAADHDTLHPAGVGASLVLAQMGNVIGHVDTLLTADSSNRLALGAAAGGAHGTGSGLGQRGVHQGPNTAAAAAAAASGPGQGPHALVYKLLAGGTTPAAGKGPPGSAAGAVGPGLQQVLMTPPAKLPGVNSMVAASGDGALAGGVCGWGGSSDGGVCGAAGLEELECDVNPVSSPDGSPAVSGSSSQVSLIPEPCWAGCWFDL